MKVACRVLAYSELVFLVLFVAGCGGGGGIKPAKVTGLVTFNGEYLEGANVIFHNDELGDWMGQTDAEGQYRMLAPPGEYRVAISKWIGEEQAELSDEEQILSTMSEFEADPRDDPEEGNEQIPEKYSDLSMSTLKFTVPSGGSDAGNFSLTGTLNTK